MKTALRVEQGKVVYPKDGELVYPRGGKVPDLILLDPRAGGKFVVYVYPSSTYAAKLVRTSPAIDPVRGLRRTMLRDANVVVIVEPPRSNLERRIRQILESL